MSSDNASTNRDSGIPLPQTLYRGLYVRVAKRLGVDPSYVSRVARGERYSRHIENALRQEIEEISKRLRGRRPAPAYDESALRRNKAKRLRFFVKRNRSRIRQDWLLHCQGDPNLRSIKISAQRRTSPILPLVEEALKVMKFTPREIATLPMKAAEEHGRLRRAQGYPAPALVEDYNLIRRCISSVAEKHYHELDTRLLLYDLSQLGEVLDLQLQNALKNFLGV
jgi:hypothetical protein